MRLSVKSLFHIVTAACFLSLATASAQQVQQTKKTTTTVKKKQQYVVQPKAAPVAQPVPVVAPPVEPQPQPEPYYAVPKPRASDGREFTDLIYVPAPGKFLLSAALQGYSLNVDAYQTGSKVAQIKTTGAAVQAGVQVGIFKNTSISAKFISSSKKASYDFEDAFTTDTENKSSGWENPEFAAQFRPMTTEYTGLFDIVLEGFYSPDLVKSKIATSVDDGTMGAGRPKYGANVFLYRKWDWIEGAFGMGYTFKGESDSEDATTGETITTQEGAVMATQAGMQAKLTSFLYGNAKMIYEVSDAGENKYNTGLKSTFDKTKLLRILVGGTVVFVPEVSSLSGSIGVLSLANSTSTNTSNVVTDTKDGSGVIFTLSYMHQF
jgi:hypothetical protein